MEAIYECDHCYDCHLMSVFFSGSWVNLLPDSDLREDMLRDKDRGMGMEDGAERGEGTGRIC